jgi:hypothetical protein
MTCVVANIVFHFFMNVIMRYHISQTACWNFVTFPEDLLATVPLYNAFVR